MPLPHGQILKDYVARKGMTIEGFAQKLDVSRQTVYNYFEKQQFDDVLISELEQAGVKDAKKIFAWEPATEARFPIPKGVPYLPDIDAIGGIDGAAMDVSEYLKEYIFVPFFSKADYYVNVRGDSMYGRYRAGDIIAIKQIKDLSEIQYGQVYVVITNENRVLKYVRKGSKESTVSLLSENPKFDPYELERKRINAMFLVLGKITKDVL